MSRLLVVLLLTSCTLNFSGSEQDYDLDAVVEAEGCTVTITRTEAKREKKADVTSNSEN